ncbi:proline dehydrogenase [Phytophthora oleae]|uniref:Proline dehydrogenase n=1 Tax=Phytophthora oleae TaxID=2107226 RepID=A0ABD3G3S9_9STRA
MSKVPLKFEEFYEAFGKSVQSDVIFEDGQVHVVPRKKDTTAEGTSTTQQTAVLESPTRKHAKGRLLDSADRRRLPWPIRALLETQEPDGSWFYSSSFEFIINDVAPPPTEGISGKLWATAIAITVWRQFPEYFELLETNYEKAMLHADENVLRLVRSVLQFDAFDQIRPYKSDEARVIREKLAREAAAKREQEHEEELKIIRKQEEEVRIGKLSLVHARRLPMPTQKLFVTELGNEITKVFPVSTVVSTTIAVSQMTCTFKVGQIVESRRRRRTSGSALSVATTPPRWHQCRVVAIDEDSRLLQLDFLHGDCERERRIPMKFVRATTTGTQEIRAAEFEELKSSWSQPITCKAEISRLEEARAIKSRPLPWDYQHHLVLQVQKPSSGGERVITSQCPRSSTRRPTSRESRIVDDPNQPIDSLFQDAAVVLLRYDRACVQVREAAQAGAKRYAAAVLYRERLHAFDDLTDSLVVLVEITVEVLDAIWSWKRGSPRGPTNGNTSKTFIWKGDAFVPTLVRSLNFLGVHRELSEWYGEEFPLDGNPFMRSLSLLDKANECGLQPTTQEQQPHSSGALRAALKLHRDHVSVAASSAPMWWPEARYSLELQRRIDLAEQASD